MYHTHVSYSNQTHSRKRTRVLKTKQLNRYVYEILIDFAFITS